MDINSDALYAIIIIQRLESVGDKGNNFYQENPTSIT
jgi:hypothetical protein